MRPDQREAAEAHARACRVALMNGEARPTYGSPNLRGANPREANLRDADLRDANLRSADLCGANLRGADLNGTRITFRGRTVVVRFEEVGDDA